MKGPKSLANPLTNTFSKLVHINQSKGQCFEETVKLIKLFVVTTLIGLMAKFSHGH